MHTYVYACVCKEAGYVLLYGILFMTVVEPGEERIKIFPMLCRMFYTGNPGRQNTDLSFNLPKSRILVSAPY